MTTTTAPEQLQTSTDTTTRPKATGTRRVGRIRYFVAGLVAVVLGLVAFTSPASAQPVQVYASSTINGMWHSGNTQYWSGNTKFTFNTYFNDRAGDVYCTQLKFRVYQSNGHISGWINGSVCGGRAATLGNTVTAAPGTTITRVQIWTVRADGAFGSYVWDFIP